MTDWFIGRLISSLPPYYFIRLFRPLSFHSCLYLCSELMLHLLFLYYKSNTKSECQIIIKEVFYSLQSNLLGYSMSLVQCYTISTNGWHWVCVYHWYGIVCPVMSTYHWKGMVCHIMSTYHWYGMGCPVMSAYYWYDMDCPVMSTYHWYDMNCPVMSTYHWYDMVCPVMSTYHWHRMVCPVKATCFL